MHSSCLFLAAALLICAIASPGPGEVQGTVQGLMSGQMQTAMPAELKEIRAEDMLKSFEGDSSYDRVRIIGDIDLARRGLPSLTITNSVVEGNISLSSLALDGDLDFSNTSFLGNATFFRIECKGETNFNGSRFYEDANFSESRFLDGATFDFCDFGGGLDMSACDFPKFASFYNATFRGKADFGLSHFSGVYANFESALFDDDAHFSSAQFATYLSITDAIFMKTADFHASTFNLGVNFMNARVLGYADFSRSQFGKEALFNAVSFNSTVNFISSRFDGPSIFKRAQFCKDAFFSSVQFIGPSDFSRTCFNGNLTLNNARINTMVFDNSTFNQSSRLFLARSDINRFMADWELIRGIINYDSSAYLSLVKNYRDLGLSEADDCYYQYRYYSQQSKTWGWPKLFDMLAQVTCGYGVRPNRPVICSLFLLMLCTTIFFLGKGLKSPAKVDGAGSFFDSLYYCLAIFFTIPLPDLKPVGRYRYVPVFLRALSWILFAILISTLSKVMIK